MAFRFFTRKTLFPGITLNLSKSGPSVSVGPRGFRHTIGPRGRRTTVGLPGTGLSYSVQHGKRRAPIDEPWEESEVVLPLISVPDPEIIEAEEDRTFLRALVAFQGRQNNIDLQPLENLDAADSHWLLGMAHLRERRWQDAGRWLERALQSDELGKLCSRNGVSLRIDLPITPEITAHISPEPRSTTLALAEALQADGDLRGALKALKALNTQAPDDAIVAASLAEIALELDDSRSMPMNRLMEILGGARTKPEIAWAVLLQEARARTRYGDHQGAIEAYGKVKEHAESPDEVAKLAWYEMALTYGEAGDRTRCRQELSGLYAVDKGFADVEDRLRSRTINRTI